MIRLATLILLYDHTLIIWIHITANALKLRRVNTVQKSPIVCVMYINR